MHARCSLPGSDACAALIGLDSSVRLSALPRRRTKDCRAVSGAGVRAGRRYDVGYGILGGWLRSFGEREGSRMTVTYDKEITALLVIDPYNDFISEGGKLWDRLRAVAEANNCVPHMLQVLNAARKAQLRVFYALHHRYRPGDYETWKYIA